MGYKLFLLFALATSFSMASEAQLATDTVKVIDKVDKVVVTKNGDITEVQAEYRNSQDVIMKYTYEVEVTKSDTINDWGEFSDSWGMDFPFLGVRKGKKLSNKGKNGKMPNWNKGCRYYVSRDIVGLRHFYWGWRFNYGDKGYVKNCFEVGIRDVIGVSWKRRGAELEVGVGFGMKRLLANDGYLYVKEGDKVCLDKMAGLNNIRETRLDVWTFHVPVLYNQKIGSDVGFSLGGILNFNSYAKARSVIGEDKQKTTIVFKGLQQNLVTADAIAMFRICGIGLYGAWSPMNLFKGCYGPELKGWSIGVDLSF